MVEFIAVGGKPIFINPALVEAVLTANDGPGGNPRAGIKLASGKDYEVDGTAHEVANKLFPPTMKRTGTLGL